MTRVNWCRAPDEWYEIERQCKEANKIKEEKLLPQRERLVRLEVIARGLFHNFQGRDESIHQKFGKKMLNLRFELGQVNGKLEAIAEDKGQSWVEEEVKRFNKDIRRRIKAGVRLALWKRNVLSVDWVDNVTRHLTQSNVKEGDKLTKEIKQDIESVTTNPIRADEYPDLTAKLGIKKGQATFFGEKMISLRPQFLNLAERLKREAKCCYLEKVYIPECRVYRPRTVEDLLTDIVNEYGSEIASDDWKRVIERIQNPAFLGAELLRTKDKNKYDSLRKQVKGTISKLNRNSTDSAGLEAMATDIAERINSDFLHSIVFYEYVYETAAIRDGIKGWPPKESEGRPLKGKNIKKRGIKKVLKYLPWLQDFGFSNWCQVGCEVLNALLGSGEFDPDTGEELPLYDEATGPDLLRNEVRKLSEENLSDG